ncbi:MAG TPA: polysaccharide biosynthesis/export family protein [Gemmatimonadales bacterium]|nr:polysaccharide biosynthesis/export family protein [Gemmatimonadales bacterium]
MWKALAMLTAITSGAAAGVQGQDTRRSQATRTELEASLVELEKYAASSGYSSRLRSEKAREASLIRARLEAGDLQVGDYLEVLVVGQLAYSDTFAVASGRVLTLPGLPDIPLQGVLRSEVQGYLQKQLSRYIRDPEVRVRTMIRLSVFGSVGKPGFYQIPADVPATEAFMIAGGPALDADPSKVKIRRSSEEIWSAEAFQEAMRQGLTLDQMNLRAGDELVLDPRKRPGSISLLTIAGALGGLASTFYFIRAIF